jgi:hypothetical protein
LKAAKRVQKKVDEMFPQNSGASVCYESVWGITRLMITQDSTEAQAAILKNKWTMTHSFWAIMGGIAVDVNGSEPFLPSDIPPKLTEQGIYFLIKTRPDLLPDIPEDEVKDKSKGDWLTKALACIQAMWFCVSCLVRVGQGLTMSLLELNTFAHAMCTIVVYFIWWQKPLDIERPLLLNSEAMRPLAAFMWMSSKTSARPQIKSAGDWSYTVSEAPEFEAIKLGKPFSDAPRVIPEVAPITVSTWYALYGTKFCANENGTRWTVQEHYDPRDENPGSNYTITRTDPAEFILTESDARRWRLGYEAFEKYSLEKPTKDLNLITIKPVPNMFDTPPETYGQDPTAYFRLLWELLGFSMLAAAYGSFHALAWNARFPSRSDKIVWRVSSLLVASPAGVVLLIILVLLCSDTLAIIAKRVSTHWGNHEQHGGGPKSPTIKQLPDVITFLQSKAQQFEQGPLASFRKIFQKIFGKITWEVLEAVVIFLVRLFCFVSIAAFSALYLPARAYLVVESFRMAFHLPPNAFKATEWEKYFPHIG